MQIGSAIVDGAILQLGSPQELARAQRPLRRQLHGANLLPGVAAPGRRRPPEVVLDGGGIVWTADAGSGRVAVAVYPWEVSISREMPTTRPSTTFAPVVSIVPLGNRVRVRVGPVTAEVTAGSAERLGIREGDVVVASFKATGARLLSVA